MSVLATTLDDRMEVARWASPGNVAAAGVPNRTPEPGDKEEEAWAGPFPWTLSLAGWAVPHNMQHGVIVYTILTGCADINIVY